MITIVWVFAISTFLSTGHGVSVGLASSPDYVDEATCERARTTYEAELIRYQTPTRRVSTLACKREVRP